MTIRVSGEEYRANPRKYLDIAAKEDVEVVEGDKVQIVLSSFSADEVCSNCGGEKWLFAQDFGGTRYEDIACPECTVKNIDRVKDMLRRVLSYWKWERSDARHWRLRVEIAEYLGLSNPKRKQK